MRALANRTKHVVIVDDTEWVDVESAMTVRMLPLLVGLTFTPKPTLILILHPDRP